VFGDLLTGQIIEEISLQGVSLTRGFGQGELRGSFQLDQSGKSNSDLIAATEEGRSYVICIRDAQPVWGGFVWTRTYQSQAKVYELYCKAFEHYPEYRLVLSDFENLATEQRNIFLNLWTAMMADPNSLQITLPSSFSTVIAKDLTVKAAEYKKYSTAMDSLANGDDGFDWTIDVAVVGGAFTKTLRIGYPTLGSVEPNILYYDGEITNYWNNGTMGGRATHVYGVGAGEGNSMLTQEVIHSDLVSSGFPRYDVALSYKDITDAATLTSLTVQAARFRKAGVPIYTVEVKGDLEPEFGSYGLGDAVQIRFNDPAHNPSNSAFNSRILGWEYYPPSDDHVEYARLIFEGDVS
jgi:hypothetical protein